MGAGKGSGAQAQDAQEEGLTLDFTGLSITSWAMSSGQGSASGVFWAFLKMGCVAFGGPVAHLGYFQEEFVRKRKWIENAAYADLVTLCQFLPGPSSSQVGFALGLHRAGLSGAFAAWLGFTLPSMILMMAFGLGIGFWGVVELSGWIIGLKLVAVAVVANAVWSMAQTLCPDAKRAVMALLTTAFLLLTESPVWQIGAILGGGLVGYFLFRKNGETSESTHFAAARYRGWPYLMCFFLLLAALPLAVYLGAGELVQVIESFYLAGSLVFGGGHVILPLLDGFTVAPGWIDSTTFLAGYGAAQALPGPLFAVTSFLGMHLTIGPGGLPGGFVALMGAFLPSWLLVMGVLPYWDQIRQMRGARAALMGTNAAVVGVLLAALYDPIWTASITDAHRLAFALVIFILLRFARIPVWLLVFASAGAGALLF